MLCAVCGCKNYNRSSTGHQKNVRYYSFPKDPDLLRKWVLFCKRIDEFNTSTSRICSDHFTPNDTERNMQFEMGFMKKNLLKLKPGSIPSIYKDAGKKAKDIVSTTPPSEPDTILLTSDSKIVIVDPNKRYLQQIKELQEENARLRLNEEKLKELQQENFRLKLNEEKLHKTIKALDIKLTKSNWQNTNMEVKLKTIFTDAQIKKLKTGKQMRWSVDDVTKSINLYSASSRAYNLLKKEKFPLPSVRTLQRWSQKGDPKARKLDSKLLQVKLEEKDEESMDTEEEESAICTEDCIVKEEEIISSNSGNFDYGDHSYYILEETTLI